MGPREMIAEFANLFYEQRNVASAFERFVAENYIQHNPAIGDGRDAAIEHLRHIFTVDARFDIQRILVDGDLAAIHVRAMIPGRPVLSVMDFYRLEGDLIAEHWDTVQPMPEKYVNEHPLF